MIDPITTCVHVTPAGQPCDEPIPQDLEQLCGGCDRWFCDEHLHVFDPVGGVYRCTACTERMGGGAP